MTSAQYLQRKGMRRRTVTFEPSGNPQSEERADKRVHPKV